MRRGPVRVYVDTSVYGGVFDDEFAEASEAFFARARAGALRLVASPAVDDELLGAPQRVRDFASELLAVAETTRITEEALQLRQAYLSAGIVGAVGGGVDALHSACGAGDGGRVFRHCELELPTDRQLEQDTAVQRGQCPLWLWLDCHPLATGGSGR